jgi:hypothetical protein
MVREMSKWIEEADYVADAIEAQQDKEPQT